MTFRERLLATLPNLLEADAAATGMPDPRPRRAAVDALLRRLEVR